MKKLLFLCLSMLSLLLMAGCGDNAPQASDASKDGKIRIVTSFYPIYITTANITQGVDGVELVNMTKPQTGCLHDYQLTTEDMRTLSDADIFVANGAGMEAFLDKIVNEQKNLTVVDASKDIPLLEEDGEANPHVWLNIDNAIQQTKNIADQLAAADPAHGDAYQANAAAYVEKLQTLKTELHSQLDALPHRDIVTFHEAFPYFAQEFNLHIAKVIAREPGTEPSPKELQEIIETVNALPVKILFTEPQYSATSAETISRETGARIFTLDPVVTGEANDQALDAYLNTMRQNAATLQEALQ